MTDRAIIILLTMYLFIFHRQIVHLYLIKLLFYYYLILMALILR